MVGVGKGRISEVVPDLSPVFSCEVPLAIVLAWVVGVVGRSDRHVFWKRFNAAAAAASLAERVDGGGVVGASGGVTLFVGV